MKDLKKIIEIECCSQCPHSNMATTACMFDGEEKDLPDNVLLDRIIPEWCKLESKLSQPVLTDEEIEIEAEKYAIKRHGLGEEWQPDREESALGFIEGTKLIRGTIVPIKIENVTGEPQPNPKTTITGEADPRLLNQLRIHWKWLKNQSYEETAKFCTAFRENENKLKEAFLDGWDACADNSHPIDGAPLQRIADYDKWKKGG